MKAASAGSRRSLCMCLWSLLRNVVMWCCFPLLVPLPLRKWLLKIWKWLGLYSHLECLGMPNALCGWECIKGNMDIIILTHSLRTKTYCQQIIVNLFYLICRMLHRAPLADCRRSRALKVFPDQVLAVCHRGTPVSTDQGLASVSRPRTPVGLTKRRFCGLRIFDNFFFYLLIRSSSGTKSGTVCLAGPNWRRRRAAVWQPTSFDSPSRPRHRRPGSIDG